MPLQSLDSALSDVRALLLDHDRLVRAVAAGSRRGHKPSVVRANLRPVVLKAGPRLHLATSDGIRPQSRNFEWGQAATAAIDAMLAEPFGNWHVETTEITFQLRVSKKGTAQVHRSAAASLVSLSHDRNKEHLLAPGDPLFDQIGGSAAKRRQVDAFLRALAAVLPPESAVQSRDVSEGARRILRVADLGCGNAYLTFAAYRWLSQRGFDVEMIGIDARDDQRRRNTEIAEQLGWSDRVHFVNSTIADARISFRDVPGSSGEVDIVLALHACDTATDEALERALAWGASSILAAPCCHHDIAAQLRNHEPPRPYGLLTRYPILRERMADELTDALRAALLRMHGYHVDVVEFVESKQTPRNLLLRGRQVGLPASDALLHDYNELVSAWKVTPRLATLLRQHDRPGPPPSRSC